MKKLLAAVICGLVLTAPCVAAMELEDALALIPEDDVMISYDGSGRAQLEAAIEAFRQALGVTVALNELDERAVTEFSVAPELQHVVVKLSQCYYTYADVFQEPGSDAARNVYLKGKHWGLKSLRMYPDFARAERDRSFEEAVTTVDDVPALYWANANWLRAAEFDVLRAVTGRVPPKSEAIALRILELEPSYVSYGAYRSLGAFWSGLPSSTLERWAVAAAGMGRYVQDLDRALEYFCHVVDEPDLCPHGPIDPSVHDYLENRLFFAEYYLMEAGRWDDAARVLQSILDAPVGERYPLYNTLSQERAAKLLAQVNRRR